MGKVRFYLLMWGVVNSTAQEVILALMDKILSGPELLRIIKAAVAGLRLSGVSSEDIDQIKLISTQAEYNALNVVDGDGVLFLPKALIEKLQIDLDKI